jgi:hypothetical protein
MTSGNPAHSEKIVEEFCKLCSTAYWSWYLRKYLFDDESNKKYLEHRVFLSLFGRLCDINQHHWLLQLAKLHDPAVQSGQINLTINYMIEYGGWEAAAKDELTRLKEEMEMLSKPTRIARNKIISHNDLAAILDGGPLGGFNAGDDIKYFDDLLRFANIVYEKTKGEICLFDDTVKGDIEIFMHHFKRMVSCLD